MLKFIAVTLLLIQFAQAQVFKCRLVDPCQHAGPLQIGMCIFENFDVVLNKTNSARAYLYTYKIGGQTKRYTGDLELGKEVKFWTDSRFTSINVDIKHTTQEYASGIIEFKEHPYFCKCIYYSGKGVSI